MKRITIFLLLLLFLGAAQAQEPAKLTPIVHLFANAEFNPTPELAKDYSFWIGRTLFGFNYKYDDKWSARILIDRTRLTGSMNTMYVKVANLRWTPDDRFALEMGAVNQNDYVPYETFYGYRFMAETFQDRYYGIPSSDIGLMAYYKVGKILQLDAGLTNGEGPRIDQDNFGKLKLATGATLFPSEKFRARVFYHLKESGEDKAAPEQLFTGYVGFQSGDKLRLGVEYTYITGYQNIPGYITYGSSAFLCLTLYKSLTWIARFDDLFYRVPESMPNLKPIPGNAFITGFSFSPIKNITLCLNYQGFYSDFNVNPDSHRFLFSFEYRI